MEMEVSKGLLLLTSHLVSFLSGTDTISQTLFCYCFVLPFIFGTSYCISFSCCCCWPHTNGLNCTITIFFFFFLNGAHLHEINNNNNNHFGSEKVWHTLSSCSRTSESLCRERNGSSNILAWHMKTPRLRDSVNCLRSHHLD